MTVKGEAHFPGLREIDLSYQIIKKQPDDRTSRKEKWKKSEK
jgi:hypothetical protein